MLTGATNWTRNGTRYSQEDLLIIDSPELAADYGDNFADLLHVYAGIDSGEPRSQAPVLFHAHNDQTQWGDRVMLVGNDPALGSWEPDRGVELWTSDDLYPAWAGNVNLPPGSTVEYKYLTIHPDGSVEWEPGPNRVLEIPDSGRASVVGGEYGDTTGNWIPAGYGAEPVPIPEYLEERDEDRYVSPAGLVYGDDLAHGNRATHVLAHFEDSAEKSTQGVFTISRDEVFLLIDKVWTDHASDLDGYRADDQGTRQVYDFPVGDVVGDVSGYVGGQAGTEAEVSTLRVVIQDGEELITAFPVAP